MKSFYQLSVLSVSALLAVSGCTTVNDTVNQTSPVLLKTIDVHAVSSEGVGEKIGTISFRDSKAGLLVITDLTHLPAGERGFHIHENPSCDAAEKDGVKVAALAAGNHLSSNHAAGHGNPMTGHLGDLPALKVEADGTTKATVLAPRLMLDKVMNRSIMIHAGGDNYSDSPAPLGGGGARIACGVIQ